MMRRIGTVVLTTFFLWTPVASNAQPADIIVDKKTFEMSSYTTVAGETIKSVKIGWEAAGTLKADKSNAILSSVPTLVEQSQLFGRNGLGHDDRLQRK